MFVVLVSWEIGKLRSDNAMAEDSRDASQSAYE
jgi:hypothetical protein